MVDFCEVPALAVLGVLRYVLGVLYDAVEKSPVLMRLAEELESVSSGEGSGQGLAELVGVVESGLRC